MALSWVLYASCCPYWGGRTSYLFVLSSGAAISTTAYIGASVVSSWSRICGRGCYLQVDSIGRFGEVSGTLPVTSLGRCTQECGSNRGFTFHGPSAVHLGLNVLVSRSDCCSPLYRMAVTSPQ